MVVYEVVFHIFSTGDISATGNLSIFVKAKNVQDAEAIASVKIKKIMQDDTKAKLVTTLVVD